MVQIFLKCLSNTVLEFKMNIIVKCWMLENDLLMCCQRNYCIIWEAKLEDFWSFLEQRKL